MKKFWSLLAVSSALFLGGIAQAQAPATAPTVSTETTVSTSTDAGASYDAAPSGTMPTTGGAPIAMALSGILTAAGGFLIRRKLS